MTKEEKKYTELFGDLPDKQEDLIQYIENNYRLNKEELEESISSIDKLEWKTISFTVYTVPKPTARPRYSPHSNKFYVSDSKKPIEKYISKFLQDNSIICCRCKVYLKIYLRTPVNMKNSEVYLAEKGLIRPLGKPDFDNLAKTCTDPLNERLILDDGLISDAIIELYYSIKPRIEITLQYQTGFDSEYNKKKIENGKLYKKMSDSIISNLV